MNPNNSPTSPDGLREAFPAGPWRWELSRATKRIELCGGPRFDLTVLSFARYGMSNAAPVFWSWDERNHGTPWRAADLAAVVVGREHHADWFADVDHPVARLIAKAPELYERLTSALHQLQHLRAFPENVNDASTTSLIEIIEALLAEARASQ